MLPGLTFHHVRHFFLALAGKFQLFGRMLSPFHYFEFQSGRQKLLREHVFASLWDVLPLWRCQATTLQSWQLSSCQQPVDRLVVSSLRALILRLQCFRGSSIRALAWQRWHCVLWPSLRRRAPLHAAGPRSFSEKSRCTASKLFPFLQAAEMATVVAAAARLNRHQRRRHRRQHVPRRHLFLCQPRAQAMQGTRRCLRRSLHYHLWS